MGLFDSMKGLFGADGSSSSDPNSPYFAGGSYNIFATDPEFSGAMKGMAERLNAYSAANQQQVYRPDASGFMPYQYAGMNQLAANLFNRGSASASARGMNSPESHNAVVGSALTNALPSLFALQNQNQLIPGQINRENIFMQTAALAPWQTLVNTGGKSIGSGTAYNNINAANANWWDMWNNIGSAWGSMGTAGKGGGGGGGGMG